jgi:3-hydroxybutyryl-CoA dehydrogenase
MFDEFKEPRFASPPLLKRLIMAGWYGKKSGKGFYDWSDPAKPVPQDAQLQGLPAGERAGNVAAD